MPMTPPTKLDLTSNMYIVAIHHLAKSITEEWLRSAFPSSIKIELQTSLVGIKHENSALVHFSKIEEAQEAVEDMNGQEIESLILKVEMHQPAGIKDASARDSLCHDAKIQLSELPSAGDIRELSRPSDSLDVGLVGLGIKRKSSIFQGQPKIGIPIRDGDSMSKSSFSLSHIGDQACQQAAKKAKRDFSFNISSKSSQSVKRSLFSGKDNKPELSRPVTSSCSFNLSEIKTRTDQPHVSPQVDQEPVSPLSRADRPPVSPQADWRPVSPLSHVDSHPPASPQADQRLVSPLSHVDHPPASPQADRRPVSPLSRVDRSPVSSQTDQRPISPLSCADQSPVSPLSHISEKLPPAVVTSRSDLSSYKTYLKQPALKKASSSPPSSSRLHHARDERHKKHHPYLKKPLVSTPGDKVDFNLSKLTKHSKDSKGSIKCDGTNRLKNTTKSDSEDNDPKLTEKTTKAVLPSSEVDKNPFLDDLKRKIVSSPSLKMKKALSDTTPAASTPQASKAENNPFLQGLHRPVTPPPKSKTKPVTSSLLTPSDPLQNRLRTRTVELDYGMVSRILTSLPQYFETLKKTCDAQSEVKDNHLIISFTGSTEAMAEGQRKTHCLVEDIEQSITSKEVRIPFKHIPILLTPAVDGLVQALQQKFCIEIKILKPPTTLLTLRAFTTSLHRQYSVKDSYMIRTKHLREVCAPNGIRKYVWLAEKTEACFKPVPPAVNCLLDNCYSNREKSFMYKNAGYQFNLDAKYVVDTTTGLKQLLRNESPQWSYRNTTGTVPFTDKQSKDIEHLLQFGGLYLELEGRRCTLNFRDMLLIDVKSGQTRDLQRYPKLSTNTPPEHGIILSIKGLPESIEIAEHELTEALQSEVVNEQIHCGVLQGTSPKQVYDIQNVISNFMRQYCVAFRFTECAGVILEGSSGYISGVKLELNGLLLDLKNRVLDLKQEEIIRTQQVLVTKTQQCHHQSISSENPLQLPPNWETTLQKFALLHVQEDTKEWKFISDRFNETMSNTKISRINRIQSVPLLEQYSLEKKQMEERNHGNAEETYLFHGTKDANPIIVAKSEKGIDFRFSREKRNLWGEGAYFAVKASYSNNYAHTLENGHKQMMLVSVLLGRSCNYGSKNDPSLKMPPLLENEKYKRYDSVKGYSGNSDIYVVYSHAQAYPAYIITYK